MFFLENDLKHAKKLDQSFNSITILYIRKEVASELGNLTNTEQIWSVDSLC